ncbi:MAG: AAA family ATPase [Pseudomonadales bacterium]|nr:AAA family ATPase [Pseudomonadales bacterium]
MQQNKFYFSGGPYQQILQGLHDSLATPEAFIKLMGPAHSGKSTLCDKLAQYMRRKDYRVVHFDYAIESPEMLRTMLARELDLPNLTNFARVLEDALIDNDDKPLILIFDDAHLLTDITLIEIYRLAEVQTGAKRMPNVVLCGDISLEQRLLSNSEFKSLLLQVSHKFYLEPMDPETLNLFFVTYLDKAGMPGLQLEPTAMNYFYKSCKGYPEPATAICRLMVESRLGKTELSPISKYELSSLIKGASANQNLPSTGFRDNNQLMVFIPVFAVLAIASLGFLYQQINSNPDTSSSTDLIAAQNEADEEAVFENTAETETPAQPSAAVLANNQADDPTITEQLEEVPVSDSNLALVTAAERGVLAAEIAEPQYESLLENADEEATTSAPVEPRERRVLTLEEEDSADSAIVLSANVVVEEDPVTLSAEPIATVDGPSEDEETLEITVADIVETDAIEELEVDAIETNEESVIQSIQVSVEAWVNAWQSQSLPDYFSYYHDEFAPRYQDTQSAWRANRQRVISNAVWIRLELSEFQLIAEENGVYEVHFWLAYESPTYSDNTFKKLLVQLVGNDWKILEEINLVVES